jgi:SAM-dependent methyltransferase
MTTYEPGAYWEELLAGAFNESGVGYPQLGRAMNLAMYRATRRSVSHALAASGLDGPPRRVLDVGSGTGYWIDFWRRHGAERITGVDLTATSVERLRRRWPQHEFLQLDIGEPDLELPGGQDVISAMSVLLHIVDEARFRKALATLARALRPNGTLLLVEPVVVHAWWGPPFGANANSRARPLAEYRSALELAGLELQLLRPATALFANVVDTRSPVTFRLLWTYWDLLTRAVGRRERLGEAVAKVLEPVDRLAVQAMPTGPSAKVLLARRIR